MSQPPYDPQPGADPHQRPAPQAQPEPGYAEPGYAEPGYAEPGYAQQQPGYQQFVPQHLAMPQQSAPGPYPQPMPGQAYPYPPQPFQQMVVVNDRRRVNHPLHLILTLLTAGLWLPVWIILMIANS